MRQSPSASTAASESCHSARPTTDGRLAAISAVIVRRAPKWSVSTPSGTRISEPSRTGTATITAVWKSERPIAFCRSGDSGPSRLQA
jgi:hypothetical protein